MKPEFMRPLRAVSAALLALLVAVGLIAVSPALAASAHVLQVSATCEVGIAVTLTDYPAGSTVAVDIDGASVTGGAEAFTSQWSKSFGWDSAVAHTYRVSVVSPDDPDGSLGWTTTRSGDVAGCPPAPLAPAAPAPEQSRAAAVVEAAPIVALAVDAPVIQITGHVCAPPSSETGSISFLLSGVTSGLTYTVELYEEGALWATTTSLGGAGTFTGLHSGIYTVRAYASGVPAVESGPVTLTVCRMLTPDIEVAPGPCVTAGPSTVAISLSSLDAGMSYRIRVFTEADVLIETVDIVAPDTTFVTAIPVPGPGTYYASVSTVQDDFLVRSSDTVVDECAVVTVAVVPCVGTGAPDVSMSVTGLSPSTVYTVSLVNAALVTVAQTTTPGTPATTFAHVFTDVSAPASYVVTVTGAGLAASTLPVATVACNLTTLAPPTIELLSDRCDGVAPPPRGLTAVLGDLNPAATYVARVVNSAGTVVSGGEGQTVTGVSSATLRFPAVSGAGAFTAQLLVNPGEQLAATSSTSQTVATCLAGGALVTLAATGPGSLLPIGTAAAVLLALGAAMLSGRLRRRVA